MSAPRDGRAARPATARAAARSPRAVRWGAAILAAGASTRMGRPKMLLPWGRSSVIGRAVSLARMFPGTQIALVIANGDQHMAAELRRLRVSLAAQIVNLEPHRGMFSSVQCAARWNGWDTGLTHWALMLGDQPQIKLATLRRLADFASAHPDGICQPAWNGQAPPPGGPAAAVLSPTRAPRDAPRCANSSMDMQTTSASSKSMTLALTSISIRRPTTSDCGFGTEDVILLSDFSLRRVLIQ